MKAAEAVAILAASEAEDREVAAFAGEVAVHLEVAADAAGPQRYYDLATFARYVDRAAGPGACLRIALSETGATAAEQLEGIATVVGILRARQKCAKEGGDAEAVTARFRERVAAMIGTRPGLN